MSLNPPAPALRLRLDHAALEHNWRVLNAMSGEARAGAAVKANAYGLGIDAALPVLRDAGARDFFVAHWGEVPGLLPHVPADQISVLHGPLNAADCAYARAVGVKPVINSVHQARLWQETGGGRCDLMIDTGMNRLGIAHEDAAASEIAALDTDVLLSHLASADEESALNHRQLVRFAQACAAIPARRRSLANSAGITLGPDYAFDVTRPGLSLYGGVPCPALEGQIRQVATIEVAIIQCRDISPGETVGYNATFTADRPIRAGVVSIGYADGFLRSWGGKGALRSHGAALPILGRISMDMVIVDLAAMPSLREGDWIEVPYDLPEAAQVAGLTQYELLTILGQRFQRL
ncbi:alanine racemase [Caenibius tardaugens NBRC 16725]|uniref:alanine racemase n=1 Tax=Caenibius tardaugens NBRC 16725 TaxID=1219035 RepID=U2YM76_9SPHN|nr:alanine racemase [Caenibius tardaugens]AZI37854.1 alanine racemase [Caenibius tardaugens NBRC 16725]GAD49567.1 alanine racemase [Caenibius tardaugens NBRC 16725]